MPPKFNLKLDVPAEEPAQSSSAVMGSLRLNNDGITVLTASYNPVAFTSEGMVKGNGEIAIKIAERDIKILKRLGAGASSTVFKGFYFKENKFVALKKISAFEKETRHQMMNDIKALTDAKHVSGLISFFGAYSVPDSGQITIVLEYMDGGSLADVLSKVGQIPENALGKITSKILVGLNYLHKVKHMVHRDIKPANILMNLEGEPKITDFGISAFIDSTLAVCQTFMGTVTYMSPERINNEQYSFSADIWSLGLALIELATGKYPYDASQGPLQLMIQVLNEDVPLPPRGAFSDEFRDFISLCMKKSPYERPTAEQLLQHPFILKNANAPVDLKSFMQCVFDPHEKLDEISIVFAYNYYGLLSMGLDRLKDLAPLYTDQSILVYEGERAQGRRAIIGKLQQVAQMHAGFRVQHVVQEVDGQPLGLDGSAIVHVQGLLQMPGVPGGGTEKFSEVFILSQINPGQYCVANQCYRLLQR